MNPIRSRIYDEIETAQAAADRERGGAPDARAPVEWVEKILEHSIRAVGSISSPSAAVVRSIASRLYRTGCVPAMFRQQMLDVATLAVGAIEAHDRQRAARPPSSGR